MTSAQQLSEEQEAVVRAVVDKGENVQCQAFAGSGKTTTAIATARKYRERYPDRDVLMLMYNTALKDEARQKTRSDTQIHADSFHSAVTYFGVRPCGSNNDIAQALLQPEGRFTLRSTGLLIIDEAQDLTKMFYDLVRKVLRELGETVQLVLFGDVFQTVNKYNKSDWRYFGMPNDNFSACSSRRFARMRLTISWRLSVEMVTFVNTYVHPKWLKYAKGVSKTWLDEYTDVILALWGDGLRADPKRQREPGSVKIIPCGTFYQLWLKGTDAVRDFATALRHGMATYGSSIYLIASSVKRNATASLIIEHFGKMDNENWITLHSDNNISKSAAILNRKRIASAINGLKGTERDAVFAVSFDEYLEADLEGDPMPAFCQRYTTVTRARKFLCVTWGKHPYVTYRQSALEDKTVARRKLCVTDVLQHVPFDATLHNMVQTTAIPLSAPLRDRLRKPGPANMIVVGRHDAVVEDVRAIVGSAVELGVAMRLGRCNSVHRDKIVATLASRNPQPDADLKEWVATMWPTASQLTAIYNETEPVPVDVLPRMALVDQFLGDSYSWRWRQLRHHDWHAFNTYIAVCIENTLWMLYELYVARTGGNAGGNSGAPWPERLGDVCKVLNAATDYQVGLQLPLGTWMKAAHYAPNLSGYADFVVSSNLVVELKVAKALESDHAHQAMLYASMHQLSTTTTQTELEAPIVILPNRHEMHRVVFKKQEDEASGSDCCPQAYQFVHTMVARKVSAPDAVCMPEVMCDDYKVLVAATTRKRKRTTPLLRNKRTKLTRGGSDEKKNRFANKAE